MKDVKEGKSLKEFQVESNRIARTYKVGKLHAGCYVLNYCDDSICHPHCVNECEDISSCEVIHKKELERKKEEKKEVNHNQEKVILVINKPRRCVDCPCYNHAFGVCQVTNTKVMSVNRERNCPLKVLPEKIEEDNSHGYRCGYIDGWNHYYEHIN